MTYFVEEQPNPSTDFFVLPAISTPGGRIIRCRGSELPTAADLTGALVVFVRYVPRQWMKLVESARARLAGIVFFMDDDVLDPRASVGMPWRYRLKLARLAASRKQWLRRQDVALWVSTPYLQQKYSGWPARLVLPSPIEGSQAVRRVFYHGTASHGAEIRWLRPVMDLALRRDERLAFEIVGGEDVYRLYRKLPRVTVVHPMKWPAYQAFLGLQGRHIGLAPQLDLPFNRARSYTKFFDMVKTGAIGIFSPGSACADVVRHGIDGLVVELEQEAWAEAVLRLAADPALCNAMLSNAQLRLGELAARAKRPSEQAAGLDSTFLGVEGE